MKRSGEKLRFVYLGNLGRAHDVPLLLDFLRALTSQIEVELGFVGTAKASLAPVRETAQMQGIRIEEHAPIPFDQLAYRLPLLKFDFGLVAFSEQFVGLLSPSKFSGYLIAGLPIVYLGPPGTNAALVCDRFGAGLRLDRSSLGSEAMRRALQQLLAQRGSAEVGAGVVSARAYFDSFNGEHLARELLLRA